MAMKHIERNLIKIKINKLKNEIVRVEAKEYGMELKADSDICIQSPEAENLAVLVW